MTTVVSILVISYNTRAMTLECLRSVIAETSVPYELVVLDNASPDGSAAAIAGPPRRPADRERGQSRLRAGNNLAARAARGRYLLLLNPDTLVLGRAIDRLVAFAERTPAAGIWGGRTLKGDRTLDPACAFGDQTLWSLFCRTTGLALAFPDSPLLNSELYGGWQRDSERAVDVVQGCFLLIRRELWQALGGFDPTFAMYGEEADLCARARALGAAPRLTPEATIVHYGGAASARRADKEIMIMRARVTLARRHLPRWQRPLAAFLLRMWPLSRSLGGALVGRLTGREGARAAPPSGATSGAAAASGRAAMPADAGRGAHSVARVRTRLCA